MVSYRLQQQIMGNAVKEGLDVKIQHPVLLPAPSACHSQRVMGATPRTIAVTVGMEDRLKPPLQPHQHRRLSHSIGRGRHPEHPDSRPVILSTARTGEGM